MITNEEADKLLKKLYPEYDALHDDYRIEYGAVERLKKFYYNNATSDQQRLIIEAGMAVNDTWEGYTPVCSCQRIHAPLWYAATTNDVKMMQFLLDKGADVEYSFEDTNPFDESIEYTPLYCTYGNPEATELLFKYGANPNKNFTMVCFYYPQLVESYINAGADVNLETDDLPLNAVLHGYNWYKDEPEWSENYIRKIIKLFIDKGADVNKENSSGDSPSMFMQLYGLSKEEV